MDSRKREKPECGKCVFRSGRKAYLCNYSYLMGHTRRAQPPEQCTFFVEGEMLETPEEAKAFFGGKRPEPVRKRTQCDWEKAAELYGAGKNDCQIARELKCASSSVRTWRKRNGLPPNIGRGKRRREDQENEV